MFTGSNCFTSPPGWKESEDPPVLPLPPSKNLTGVAGPGLGWGQDMLPRLLCCLLNKLLCFSWNTFPAAVWMCPALPWRPGSAGALWVTKTSSNELHQPPVLINSSQFFQALLSPAVSSFLVEERQGQGRGGVPGAESMAGAVLDQRTHQI